MIKKKGRAGLLLVVFIVVIVLLAYYSYGILKATNNKDQDGGITLGLDLAGGVSITYQVADGQDASSEDIADTIYKLQQRVSAYSSEAQVYQVGDDRISVEIPGVTDANEILEELGTPGSLEFQTSDGEVFMTGDNVVDAQATTYTDSTTGSTTYAVELTLDDEGAEIFSEVTGENIGDYLPIYYDDELISYPEVQSQISNGVAEITGMDSYEEAELLATQIRSGALSLELEEIQSEVVGAQLGSQAITTSIIAAIIGVFIIIAFMLIFYRIPGLAASLSLLIYSGIILALLHLYHITLTLPGIAGIILSIGMAVDANVVIFARIKEEIGLGKSVATAIDTGYKKAFSAVFDGNITTLIAAAVLYWLGSGSIRGFASTLALGIVCSMFTALLVCRWIMKALYGIGLKDKKFYGEKKTEKSINFVSKRFICIIISCAIIVAGFVGMGVYKSSSGNVLNFSLEFLGGTQTTVEFEENYTIEEIDEEIVPLIEEITGDSNVQTQKVEDSTQVIFKTRTLELEEREEFNTLMEENYGVDEESITSTNISSTISSEMRSDAVLAVVVAAICMLIYIWIRFRDIRFASSAVIMLIHDVLVVLAFYALSKTSVGTTFIACMLTLVGYSINATIVIFDRIREHLKTAKLKSDEELAEIVNLSITETLSRSINTSLTTFIMVLVLFIVGVSSIREFALPLMVGVICGGYSSVCITGPLYYMFKRGSIKKQAAAAKSGKRRK